jgi:hypothetical protein
VEQKLPVSDDLDKLARQMCERVETSSAVLLQSIVEGEDSNRGRGPLAILGNLDGLSFINLGVQLGVRIIYLWTRVWDEDEIENFLGALDDDLPASAFDDVKLRRIAERTRPYIGRAAFLTAEWFCDGVRHIWAARADWWDDYSDALDRRIAELADEEGEANLRVAEEEGREKVRREFEMARKAQHMRAEGVRMNTIEARLGIGAKLRTRLLEMDTSPEAEARALASPPMTMTFRV